MGQRCTRVSWPASVRGACVSRRATATADWDEPCGVSGRPADEIQRESFDFKILRDVLRANSGPAAQGQSGARVSLTCPPGASAQLFRQVVFKSGAG
jgi:hypothetical protein